MFSVACSPDGRRIISGSNDRTIRIWDALTGSTVGEPLEGHNSWVSSIVCSPDGRSIISGSHDRAIRIWDAATGAAVGEPLEGHNGTVLSVACSPDGRRIISGSRDSTIRIWNAETGAPVESPLMGRIHSTQPLAYPPEAQHTAAGSGDSTIQVLNPSPQVSIQHSFQIHTHLCSPPNSEGWVRDSQGALLYWVPPDCRIGLHSPALLTIPPTSHIRSVSLNFEDFAFGTSWTQIFNTAQP